MQLPYLTWIFTEQDGDAGHGCHFVLVEAWCLREVRELLMRARKAYNVVTNRGSRHPPPQWAVSHTQTQPDSLLYTEGQEETPAIVPREKLSLTPQCTGRTKYNGWSKGSRKTLMYKIIKTEGGVYTYSPAKTINVKLSTQTRMSGTTNTSLVCYSEWSCRN